jgi:hypothetical protein
MPKTIDELATMISQRDGISYRDAMEQIRDCAAEMESAFDRGDLFEVEDILKDWLGLEPDYLDLFIF